LQTLSIALTIVITQKHNIILEIIPVLVKMVIKTFKLMLLKSLNGVTSIVILDQLYITKKQINANLKQVMWILDYPAIKHNM